MTRRHTTSADQASPLLDVGLAALDDRRSCRPNGLIAADSVDMNTVGLAIGACSSDDNDAATDTADTTDTRAEPSEAPTSLAQAAGEVTPVVICVDDNRGAASFGDCRNRRR